MVYFIQQGLDGPIKIGLARNPDARRDQLQTGHAEHLYLRAVRRGEADLERWLHARFAEGRLRGEWFRADTPGLDDAMHDADLREFFPEDYEGRPVCEDCRIYAVPRGRERWCGACGFDYHGLAALADEGEPPGTQLELVG